MIQDIEEDENFFIYRPQPQRNSQFGMKVFRKMSTIIKYTCKTDPYYIYERSFAYAYEILLDRLAAIIKSLN